MAIKQFYRGSSVFKCNVCGRSTRDTGVQSAGNKICPQCYDLAGIENEISDGHTPAQDRQGEVTELVQAIAAKGGDTAQWADLVALVNG